MTTVDIDISKLQLIPDEDDKEVRAQGEKHNGDGRNNGQKSRQPAHFDPHLWEERRRKQTKQPGSPAITWNEDEGNKRRFVDVIAKVAKPKDRTASFPPQIQSRIPIGDLMIDGTTYTIATGTVDVEQIAMVREGVASLKAASELYLDLYHSLPAIHCDPPSLDAARGPNGERFPGLDGSGVIIGIVDFGCDFRHGNFRQPSGATRILYLWDQNGEKTEQSPKGYDYGREFTADAINQALQAGEDKAYETLGYTPTVAAHGTHVMDIAAGNGREPNDFGGRPGPVPSLPSHPGIAPNAQLIFVHLRTFEQGFLGNSVYLLEAVHYIFKKAKELQMPAVVNLSLSSSGGPHDGTTLVEQGLAALVEAEPGRAIVVSAGNAYMKQSHVEDTVRKGAPATILWHTDPRHIDPDRTKNEMEIWYPGDKDLEVTLYAPGREDPLGTVRKGETKELREGKKKKRLGRIIHRPGDPNNDDNHVDIRLLHLEDAREPWRIELSTKGADVKFHAWIEQDDLGLSRFEGASRRSTIGSISCNDATLSVGAFDTAVNACLARPFEASSAGPTRPSREGKEAPRPKPDLSAPGVNIVAARARGGVTVMTGTSMAAPHVTGLVALLFQLVLRAGYDLPPFARIRDLLFERVKGKDPSEPRLASKAVAPANPHTDGEELDSRLGAGRVDGQQAVAFVAKLLPNPEKFNKAPARPAIPIVQGISKNGNGQPKGQDFYVPAQLLQELLGNGHNGSKHLGNFLTLLAQKIEKQEEVRLWVESN